MAFSTLLKRFAKGLKGPVETVTATGLGFGSAAVFEPPLQAAANEMWDQFPNKPLGAGEIAQLYRRGVIGRDEAYDEARKTGVNAKRFSQLIRMTDTLLGVSEVLTLVTKGEMSEDDGLHHLIFAGFDQKDATNLIQARFSQPALGELLSLLNRGAVSEGEATAQLVRSGLPPDLASKLLALRVNEPDVSTLLTAVNRGEMSEGEATASLRRQGYSAGAIKAMMALRLAFPSPSDLVRFAVREVFNSRLVDLYGLNEDLPPQFLELAGKTGMSDEFARWYWAGHWELPSLTNAFEMFQRAIISEAELKDLMRAQDVMPFWRDKLIKLAYQPLTRVDIRRMYRDGVLSVEQVYRAHLDTGYSPEHAKALTDWVTQAKVSDTKEFTKAEIISLFEARAINQPIALESLGKIGYSPDEATLLLNLAGYRRAKSIRDRAVSVVRSRYIAKKITKEVADNLLDQLEVAPDEKVDLLKIWDLEREAQTADLTVAQMQALWKRAEIDDSEFDDDMIRRGYEPYEAERLRILATKATPATPAGG